MIRRFFRRLRVSLLPKASVERGPTLRVHAPDPGPRPIAPKPRGPQAEVSGARRRDSEAERFRVALGAARRELSRFDRDVRAMQEDLGEAMAIRFTV